MFGAYPGDPTQGSPFDAAEPTDRFFGDTNQFKRGAALYGDITYQAERRFFARKAQALGVAVYNYHYRIVPNDSKGTNQAFQGVHHGSDLNKLNESSPLGNTMSQLFALIVNNSDPNDPAAPLVWPKYDESGLMIEFVDGVPNDMDKTTDTFRKKEIAKLFSADFLDATSR